MISFSDRPQESNTFGPLLLLPNLGVVREMDLKPELAYLADATGLVQPHPRVDALNQTKALNIDRPQCPPPPNTTQGVYSNSQAEQILPKNYGREIFQQTRLILEPEVDEEHKNNSTLCSICLSNKRDALFVPCNHFIACRQCICKGNIRTCPICRKPATTMGKVYLS